MTDELSQIGEILSWVGDEPFRLFAALCLFIALAVFYFFRNESPAYKVFATIMLFFGAGGIGYSALSSGNRPGDLPDPVLETEPPTEASSGFQMVQEAISNAMNKSRHSGCIDAYAARISAIANSFPNDEQVILANDIVQMALSIRNFVDVEFPGSIAPCEYSTIIGRGFTPACQPGADAFFQIAENIISGELTNAKINAETADSVFRTCKA